jgi:hypothetical protein
VREREIKDIWGEAFIEKVLSEIKVTVYNKNKVVANQNKRSS